MLSLMDWIRRKRVDSVCPGYSGRAHWEFFKHVLSKPEIKNVCVLGVYNGRDVAYMATIKRSVNQHDFRLIGVDKFNDRYCEDWPEELRTKTWREAGFGDAPNLGAVDVNLRRLKMPSNVELRQDLAEHFLATSPDVFDFIYIDIAHDYESTVKIIDLAVPRLSVNGLIGGDDFSDQGTWGVASAVKDSFRDFQLFSNWLWLARQCDFGQKGTAVS